MKNESKVLFFVAINYLLLIITCQEDSNYVGMTTDLPEFDQMIISNLVAGAGYSSDTQQMTAQKCYNTGASHTSGQQGYVQLGSAISFTELESKLGVSVSVGGKYGMFATDVEANYMRSVQDKDYTISVNYYQYSSNNVAVQIADNGVEALNEFGKSVYQNGNNTYFGLVCGDNYISTYKQGALLTMGLNIQLNSSEAKKEFNTKIGVSFGDIVQASTKISTYSAKNKIAGLITIQAYQMGGEPSQLSQILSRSNSGEFHALACSLSAMENCISAASGLLHYAQDNFLKQISFEKNIGLTPLGVGFMEYSPINYIGLNLPVSLVTQEVKDSRRELSDKLKENQSYQQKIYSLLNGYPIKLNTSGINKAHSIMSDATHNILILMQVHDGAADCFNFPQKCKSIKDDIFSYLKNITNSDIENLEKMT